MKCSGEKNAPILKNHVTSLQTHTFTYVLTFINTQSYSLNTQGILNEHLFTSIHVIIYNVPIWKHSPTNIPNKYLQHRSLELSIGMLRMTFSQHKISSLHLHPWLKSGPLAEKSALVTKNTTQHCYNTSILVHNFA